MVYLSNHEDARRVDHHDETIDHEEIIKFSALANHWWQTEGSFKALHQINPVRLAYIQQQAHGLVGKKVLDIGCGGGILTESLAHAGAKVTGLDVSDEAISVAREHANEQGLCIHYQQQTIEQHLSDHSHYYDIITCMEMLEHVPQPVLILHYCAQLMKPHGQLFIATINRTFIARLLMIHAAEQLLGLLPKGTHNANRFIRPSELIHWLCQAGLEMQHLVGLRYHPFLHQSKLTTNLAVNYMASCRKVAF